jgi:large subunit ribosomal protein L7/L12
LHATAVSIKTIGEDNMATKEEILETIANMTVLEVSELVKAMEEKFGVTAAAPMAVAAAPAGVVSESGGEAAEEKTEFTVVLKGFENGKKIPVIKEVRALTGLGLKDAKDLVEAGDKPIKEGISKEEAQKAKEKLEAAGATVELQ